ncbi:hypothetical protein [Mycolicibacterium fortuitum]|uniref:hypothetical protein n=1 Tax=Mycolicibacterium fortuitum TaxID=1766 RepID=UPI003558CE57
MGSSAFFTSDRVAVRVVMRVGFAFPHEAALVKGWKTLHRKTRLAVGPGRAITELSSQVRAGLTATP